MATADEAPLKLPIVPERLGRINVLLGTASEARTDAEKRDALIRAGNATSELLAGLLRHPMLWDTLRAQRKVQLHWFEDNRITEHVSEVLIQLDYKPPPPAAELVDSALLGAMGLPSVDPVDAARDTHLSLKVLIDNLTKSTQRADQLWGAISKARTALLTVFIAGVVIPEVQSEFRQLAPIAAEQLRQIIETAAGA